MKRTERVKVYFDALDLWGERSQLLMVQEEIGELLSVISKYDRGRIEARSVLEEIADVRIMLEQLTIMLGTPLITIQSIEQGKLKRLKELVEKHKAKKQSENNKNVTHNE